MDYKEQRKTVQRALVPFYAGEIDGEFGPLTDAAFQALRTATGTPAPVISIPASGNPRLAIVREFSKLLGGRETDGPNRSPEINALWPFTSYPDGWKDRAPYCAATVCAAAARAAKVEPRLQGFPLPKSPSVAGLLEWAREPENRCLVFACDSDAHRPKAGDIAIFLPRVSHTGIVAEDYSGGGTMKTFEGNTNGAGSRDGDGFWAKTRPLSLAGHFIRIAATA